MAYALISWAAPGSGVRRHGSPQGDGLSLIAQLCPCSALGHQRFQDYDSNESTLQRKSGVIAGCSRAGGRDVSDHEGDGGAAHGFPKDSGTCAVLSSLRIWKSGPCRVTLYDRNLIERPSRKPGAFFFGAGGRNRTDTLSPELDFESSASTSSATPAGQQLPP